MIIKKWESGEEVFLDKRLMLLAKEYKIIQVIITGYEIWGTYNNKADAKSAIIILEKL